MADRVLFISWGEVVRGREVAALENFNETIGLYGRMQHEGRLESFDVVLLNPSMDIAGYMTVHGSSEQLNALMDAEDFRRNLHAGSLIVDDLKIAEGYTNEGIAAEMELYQEAISKVPQSA
ncbi:MAG: hypothetical protein QOF65_727 [Thermoleophilaceae bacterium]|jgi:hypothetical protein|nr:hypothetical protein [Thermoleophilaceae bacterium]MEA2436171.1 hypothetical protein [Thermoleophilaceae bacterium]